MNNTGGSLKNLVFAIGAVAVVLGILIFYSGDNQFGQKPSVNPEADLTHKFAKPRVLHSDVKGVITSFPADFPLEAGVKISQSYKYVPANSLQQQATLDYLSKKTLAENGKIFTAYLKKSGYQMLNTMEKPNLLFRYGTKDGSDLSIRLAKAGDQVLVSASYLRR